MLPHPETVIAISALRYQERLYEVARQRRALGVNAGARARPIPIWRREPAAIAWLRQIVTRERGVRGNATTAPSALFKSGVIPRAGS